MHGHDWSSPTHGRITTRLPRLIGGQMLCEVTSGLLPSVRGRAHVAQVHDRSSPAIGRITARLHRVGICHQAFRLICIPEGLVQARSVFQANHSRNFTCHREPNFRSKIWYPEPKFGIDLGIDFCFNPLSTDHVQVPRYVPTQ